MKQFAHSLQQSPRPVKASLGRVVGTVLTLAALGATATLATAEPKDALREQARDAMKKAATYYRTKVALHGGYTYYYSADLQNYWGEGVGTADQIWVEPPGTPAVGLAYLKGYAATGDGYYLEAARETGHALIHGQLESGGWSQRIDFDSKSKFAGRYRNGKGNKKGPNNSSLDDDQTQSAIIFLSRLDKALEFKDAAIHEAAMFALDSLLKAQFPIGAFPQSWTEPVADHPILKATFPKEWPRMWPREAYHRYYTLNDGLSGTVSEVLLVAMDCYNDERYTAALRRLGDFLILAQMPDPQPAWAQQYNFEMQPTWARKFEPPAISGLESEDVIRTLMKIYRATGDEKYLEPIPRALAYLKTCVLPDGRMPRFRELETNRALYMTRKPGVSGSSNDPQPYDFTYSDAKLPSHYGWKQETSIEELAAEYSALKKAGAKGGSLKRSLSFNDVGKLVFEAEDDHSPKPRAASEKLVREIVGSLDREGRWVSVYAGERLVGQPKFKKGFEYIGSHTFNRNMEVLAGFLAASERK